MGWALRREVDGSTGANGRAVSKVDTVSGKVSHLRHGTRERGQVASRMAMARKHTQMEVSVTHRNAAAARVCGRSVWRRSEWCWGVGVARGSGGGEN